MLSAATVAAPQSVVAEAASESALRYDARRHRLSVSVANQPLVDVFEQISAETGVDLVVHGADHGAITAKFEDLPLESAIKQLLAGRNYALAGATEPGEELRVWIMAPKGAAPTTPPARLRNARLRADRSNRRTDQTGGRREATGAQASERLLQILSERTEGATGLQSLLQDGEEIGSILREAMQEGDVPTELLEIMEGKQD